MRTIVGFALVLLVLAGVVGAAALSGNSDDEGPAAADGSGAVATALAGLPADARVGIAGGSPDDVAADQDFDLVRSVADLEASDLTDLVLTVSAPDAVRAWAKDNAVEVARDGGDGMTLYALAGEAASPTTVGPPLPSTTADPEPPSTTTTDSVATTTTTTAAVTTTVAPSTTTTVPEDTVDEPAPPADPPRATGDTVEVRSGDSFWSIAEDHLADDLGRAPSDAEIVTYWSQLIDANADHLADPGNPDLIHAGQVFALPPLG